jgi:hypothetical protein
MIKMNKIFLPIMAKNVKSGPDISCRKTGFRLKKLKVQPGNTAST